MPLSSGWDNQHAFNRQELYNARQYASVGAKFLHSSVANFWRKECDQGLARNTFKRQKN